MATASTTTIRNPEAAARHLVELTPQNPVISLYLDLDASRFATPPARASEIRSLLDEARREVGARPQLGHEQQAALRADVEQLERYLQDPPTEGAGALAIFCSGADGLFETVVLPHSTPAQVVIDSRPYIEPLAAIGPRTRWLVALVNRRHARLFTGPSDHLAERLTVSDDVHGQHDRGGWSQARYERSVEKEADDHLRRVAAIIARSWRTGSFHRIALGGPGELIPRLQAMLDGDVAPEVAEDRLELDVEAAGIEQITTALEPLAEREAEHRERALLDRLQAGIGAGEDGRAVGGLAGTLDALNQRRVECLMLAAGFEAGGGRCPDCGLLLAGADRCPVDGAELEPRAGALMREAMIEAALAQDADVLVLSERPELGPFGGVGAVLRF